MNSQPAIRVVQDTAADVSEQERALQGWTQHYSQLEAGRFTGGLREIGVPGVRLIHETTNLRLHQHTAPPPDSLVLGVPSLESAPARFEGQTVGAGDVILFRGARLCDFLCSGPMSILAVALDPKRLPGLPSPNAESLSSGTFSSPWAAALRSELACLLADEAAGAEAMRRAGLVMGLLDRCHQIIDGVASDPNGERMIGPSQRQALVNRARDFVAAHPDDVLSVAQIAQGVGVTTRMLEYSFADIMGMSPKEYLRMIRLNAARRALRGADPRQSTVAEIAMDHGFWHLGRFSTYYFQMYGEKPSDTLKRRAPVLA
ncbi:helix-turn-helix domain-containing protein [Azospirillum sp.]|uniref:helix-turn-helix domain-containing protein n=1 Tax=Azospirillum sp. TaxID=34012 RepID=UPI002629A009|nr:helix-turn-helix domain-containing protein [Azospirillum sp.]